MTDGRTAKRTFTQEFRNDAVKRAIKPGAIREHVARELGIRGSMLGRWVREDTQRGKIKTLIDSGALVGVEDEFPVAKVAKVAKGDLSLEVGRLSELVDDLTKERDMLKATLAFYLSKE
jgi:transposase-like protein